jgi:DNA-binding response OmpR family regulator
MNFPSLKTTDGATRADSRDDEEVVFGNYRIFPELKLLLKNGNKVDLTARAFDVLWVLVKARGEVVTKDELIEQVWAGSIVEENNLQTISRRSEGLSSKTVVSSLQISVEVIA